jgi:hypothetical protein
MRASVGCYESLNDGCVTCKRATIIIRLGVVQASLPVHELPPLTFMKKDTPTFPLTCCSAMHFVRACIDTASKTKPVSSAVEKVILLRKRSATKKIRVKFNFM